MFNNKKLFITIIILNYIYLYYIMNLNKIIILILIIILFIITIHFCKNLYTEFFANNSKLNLPIYYINMDKDKDRNEFMKDQLKDNNYKRIPGVNVKNQTKYKIDVKSKFEMPLKDSEIGCTLAHLNAIHAFLNDKHEYGLICEDDANFELINYWNISLQDIINLLNEKDSNWTTCMIYNSLITNEKNYKVIELKENKPLYGTVAYLISRKYAQYIKELTNNFTIFKNDKDVDARADYYLYYNKKSNPYLLSPSIINLNKNTNSSIDPNNKDRDKNNFITSDMIKDYLTKNNITLENK